MRKGIEELHGANDETTQNSDLIKCPVSQKSCVFIGAGGTYGFLVMIFRGPNGVKVLAPAVIVTNSRPPVMNSYEFNFVAPAVFVMNYRGLLGSARGMVLYKYP